TTTSPPVTAPPPDEARSGEPVAAPPSEPEDGLAPASWIALATASPSELSVPIQFFAEDLRVRALVPEGARVLRLVELWTTTSGALQHGYEVAVRSETGTEMVAIEERIRALGGTVSGTGGFVTRIGDPHVLAGWTQTQELRVLAWHGSRAQRPIDRSGTDAFVDALPEIGELRRALELSAALYDARFEWTLRSWSGFVAWELDNTEAGRIVERLPALGLEERSVDAHGEERLWERRVGDRQISVSEIVSPSGQRVIGMSVTPAARRP
ncbi:MAG: hypothetical protein M3Y87_30620, partial [Myxococcota bacterium]|nr:hypothetical protein [Myxococcota bacterium]